MILFSIIIMHLFKPSDAGGKFGQYIIMQKNSKMTETWHMGTHPMNINMTGFRFYILVLWTKVASALEWLTHSSLQQRKKDKPNLIVSNCLDQSIFRKLSRRQISGLTNSCQEMSLSLFIFMCQGLQTILIY